MRCRPLHRLLAAAFALLLAPAASAAEPRAALGLFTTLPLYWGEALDLGGLIAPDTAPPWARTALERDYDLVPLDVLGGEAGNLAALHYLLLAQPRALAPAENVALDAWVRAGGRLLLFADPMLTAESAFPLGDKRRPQDVALLSPILAHWGLELRFDERQGVGERMVPVEEVAAVPVNLSGTLAPLGDGGEAAQCRILAGGLVARCAIGAGAATIVADAALFEDGEEGGAEALRALTVSAFGEIAGTPSP